MHLLYTADAAVLILYVDNRTPGRGHLYRNSIMFVLQSKNLLHFHYYHDIHVHYNYEMTNCSDVTDQASDFH